MKKETIIAIFFGIIFGAVVALLILVKNKEIQLTKTKTLAPNQKISQLSKTTQKSATPLAIDEPQNGAVFNKDEVALKGNAEKNALIIMQSPIKEIIFKNEKEKFSVNFPLSLGENVITVTSHTSGDLARTFEKELRIYYLPEQL
ncbi:hypothetical protein HY357_04165 [Candidatus Roizmanbacteria bacterium]|nr:hypothetical protein [Candidatus Roizmanbacteria bacterium]